MNDINAVAKKRRGVTLLGKISIGNVLLAAVVLLITLLVTMRYAIRSMESKIEKTLMSSAQSLAGSPTVRGALLSGAPSAELNDWLDGMIVNTEDLDVITVADKTGKRIYHVEKSRIGQYFVGGDEQAVLRGERYLSNATGTMGYQRRAFCPVQSGQGEVIGFVMVSALMTRMDTMRREIMSLYADMAVIIFLFGYTISMTLHENIKNSLLGYEPTQLAENFLLRQEVLDALEEGIVSADADGTVLLVNPAAAAMLGVSEQSLVGRPVSAALPALRLADVLSAGTPQYNREINTASMTILCDKIPVRERGEPVGAVAILRNKTEATRLAEQLTGTRHIITALRANTHEFMNKLHVILGLLQMNRADEAAAYIHDIAAVQSEAVSPVLQCVENPTVAALLLGKISHMRELDIALSLLPGSFLPRHSRFLSTSSLVTVIGNLVENAIEAINEQEAGGERRVTMHLAQSEEGLLIAVDDTGVGMTGEQLARVFEQGYSTKGEGRGTGMALIRGIVEENEGDIQIESERGVGTSVTVSIRKVRAAYLPPGAKEEASA